MRRLLPVIGLTFLLVFSTPAFCYSPSSSGTTLPHPSFSSQESGSDAIPDGGEEAVMAAEIYRPGLVVATRRIAYLPQQKTDKDTPLWLEGTGGHSRDISKGSHQEIIHLKVVGTHFLCTESECTHHHKNCTLEIDYALSAENRLSLDLGASVLCTAQLSYRTAHGYELKSERCTKSECHNLHKHANFNKSLVIGFNFSAYEEVVFVRVDSIECSIDSVEANGTAAL
jgi:hypothetical protein